MTQEGLPAHINLVVLIFPVSPTTMSTGITGYVDFTYEGETYQTWYRVFGDLKATNVTPVVALHGSPGISHHSMLPNGELYETHGIPVIVYDQIGIGKSTHLTDKPRSIWTPKIFMDELDDILEKLGIASNFDLIGHSWGGMLASEYAGSRRPKGLRHLVIVSSLPSMKLWEDELRKLLEKYPEDMRRTIEKHEQENTTDHPDYQKAMRVFYAKHLCQLDPWPQEMVDAVAALTEDPVIYSTMCVFRVLHPHCQFLLFLL
jgi:proline-specific peptidase